MPRLLCTDALPLLCLCSASHALPSSIISLKSPQWKPDSIPSSAQVISVPFLLLPFSYPELGFGHMLELVTLQTWPLSKATEHARPNSSFTSSSKHFRYSKEIPSSIPKSWSWSRFSLFQTMLGHVGQTMERMWNCTQSQAPL